MVELEALGRVHRHHVHAVRALARAASSSRSPASATAAIERANSRAVACGDAAHVVGGQLGEAGEVLQPLDDLGGGGEQQLAAQAEPLDQPVHVEVRAGGVDRRGGRAVQLAGSA